MAASFRRAASTEFDRALRELIDLAFKYREMGADFLWERDPDLFDEATRICRNLSDELAEKAKAIARGLFEDSLEEYDLDESWDRGAGDDAVPVISRFDMEGSHLLDLLEIWVALAFIHSLTRGELRVLISRFLSNPFASPLWRGIPADALKWGRGYSRNIIDQISVIGQDAIISAYRHAEWMQAMARGADYYIRHRGSGYDCPECDSLCGRPIPIYIPFEWTHARCMCWPEYHYGK